MIRQPPPPFTRLAITALLLLLPTACSMFDATKVPPPDFFLAGWLRRGFISRVMARFPYIDSGQLTPRIASPLRIT